MKCADYSPGPVPGKQYAVCKHYILAPKESVGGCKHPGHFMCELWLEKLGKKVAVPERSNMEQKIFDTFPGSRVVNKGASTEGVMAG